MDDVSIQEFCHRSIQESGDYGQGAFVLLVGSRGAGYVDSWADFGVKK